MERKIRGVYILELNTPILDLRFLKEIDKILIFLRESVQPLDLYEHVRFKTFQSTIHSLKVLITVIIRKL